jgi:hypothetical protein
MESKIMKLYEINNEIEMLMESVDLETGLISDEVFEQLNQLEMAKSEKILNLACYIKSLQAEEEAHEIEQKKQEAKRRVLLNKISGLKDFISRVASGEKYKDSRVSIGWRDTESVSITDANKLPESAFKITKEASKTQIKELIESGVEVEGAEIVKRKSILIK